jgi:tetratricopeptide (TPR) repeat protein
MVAGPASEHRYRVLGEIARGGMGAVLRLMDNDIRRIVAMKVNLAREDWERLERFVEEAQITGQLEHPNIVPIHELGLNDQGEIYFTMKWVKGKSLDWIHDRLADRDPGISPKYPLSHRLQIFLKVCDAMAFAHNRGVIHRDLKPENIMVGRFGEVLVMDWGLAKVKGAEEKSTLEQVDTVRSERETGQTLEGDIMGTPAYMPPEQASGRVGEIDERSDIFALAGILYRILTFESPRTGKTVSEVLKTAVRGKITPPRKRAPGNRIPREIESICMKGLAWRKEDRYPTVEAMVEDIRAFLDHRLVKAHRYGIVPKFVRFVQRHPAGSLAGGVALLLVSVSLGVTVSLAVWAKEQKARADAENARAETESLRAEKAELMKAKAEDRATVAEETLQKGRAVSAVFRSVNVDLGEIIKTLGGSTYAFGGLEEKRAPQEEIWKRVEEFEKGIPKDSASQAAWLAAKGWIKRLAGEEKEAFALFEASRKTDPDVAYGWLFDAMVWLSKYLAGHPLPSGIFSERGVEFGEMPEESPLMKRVRDQFEARVEKARNARVWGEQSVEEFEGVLAGFRAMQRGDLAEAERGLSQALALPELVWLREELVLGRAKIRYLQKAFDEGIRDLEQLLNRRPDFADAWLYLGQFRMGKALEKRAKGEDPRPLIRSALAAQDRFLQLSPMRMDVLEGRGLTYVQLGQAEVRHGGDPSEALRRAIADLDAFLQVNPDKGSAYNNRASAYSSLGDGLRLRGEDPREAYTHALEDFDKALALRPRDWTVFFNRAETLYDLGFFEARNRRDPEAYYRRAIADFNEGLRFQPESSLGFRGRGTVHYRRGQFRKMRRMDPTRDFQAAAADLTQAMELDPRRMTLHGLRGEVHLALADGLVLRRKDPREAYRKAIADFDTTLKRKRGNAFTFYYRGKAAYSLAEAEVRRGGDGRDALEQAVRDFREVMRRKPNFSGMQLMVGNVLGRLGELAKAAGEDPGPHYAEAMAAYRKAIASGPGNWEAMANLAFLLERLERFEEAIVQMERAVEIAGENTPALKKHLQRIKEKRKRREEGGKNKKGD